jgi:hypothetical protein
MQEAIPIIPHMPSCCYMIKHSESLEYYLTFHDKEKILNIKAANFVKILQIMIRPSNHYHFLGIEQYKFIQESWALRSD